MLTFLLKLLNLNFLLVFIENVVFPKNLSDEEVKQKLENLFDNAIEASGQSEGKRKILLSIKNVNETFILKMWNNSNKLTRCAR